jgi:S1-C subfamily serine protease
MRITDCGTRAPGRASTGWGRSALCLLPLCLALLSTLPTGLHAADIRSMRKSVVKIYVTQQLEDYALPWQSGGPRKGTGSGFVIEKKRILTNAHVVSNARFIQLQKDSDPRRFLARVAFMGHDCDLAILSPEDPTFFENTAPIRFDDRLPRLNDEVTVLGYPMGGDRISLTKGVVSRVDYSVYSHSGLDQHLVLQVDAAINPGNSGGPVLLDEKVVGLAFQGLSRGENIGYAIPMPVIQHFLGDIADGKYHNYPELGASVLDTRNTALRRHLDLPSKSGGVVVYYVDPFGSARGHLQDKDVLLAIDRHDIGEDGNIELDGNTVNYAELIERKQWGDSVKFTVWRDGKERGVTVPLENPRDPFIYRNIYDKRPRYVLFAGLLFSPLNREVLRTVGGASGHNAHQLFYYSQYAKTDNLHEGRDEFIVLTRRLPHPVNTYAESFRNGIVEEINGETIRGLADVKRAFGKPLEGFHVIRFAGMEDTLVLDAAAARAATPEIHATYGVSAAEFLGEQQ